MSVPWIRHVTGKRGLGTETSVCIRDTARLPPLPDLLESVGWGARGGRVEGNRATANLNLSYLVCAERGISRLIGDVMVVPGLFLAARSFRRAPRSECYMNPFTPSGGKGSASEGQ